MKETYINELGHVRLTKRKQSRRITVRYDPEGLLKVSIPQKVTYQKGLDYIIANKRQIKEQITHLQTEQYSHDLSHFQTRWHTVEIWREDRETIAYQIEPDQIIVKIPRKTSSTDQTVQKAIRQGLEEVMRCEAKVYLPRRVQELAEQYNLKYNKLFIKKAQSLWGSCSEKNNINLNIHLMRLPDRLIDYVILHELCHTIHKDHSRRFWDRLQQITSKDVTLLKRELNQYTPKLY